MASWPRSRDGLHPWTPCPTRRAFPVQISIGGTSATPTDMPADLLARADAALYEAKGDGRNRTVIVD
ncbi:MAG: diguanylate cyclase [Chloroflexota bacterium]|nr:MAG: diguanylate cyclase [Chloroflexota bacterium]